MAKWLEVRVDKRRRKGHKPLRTIWVNANEHVASVQLTVTRLGGDRSVLTGRSAEGDQPPVAQDEPL